jgi:hypothetical protein
MDEPTPLASLRNDPEAALQLGCRILETCELEDRRHAEVCFEFARNADPTTTWRAAEAYVALGDHRAARWMAEAAASLSDPEGIVVEPLTLPIGFVEYDQDRYVLDHQDWRIAVQCDDPAHAVAALNVASERVLYVTADGCEQPDWEALAAEYGRSYSPNYAAVDEDVPLIWLDCKSGIMPAMARTVIEIVIEELRAAGITRATLRTPLPTD